MEPLWGLWARGYAEAVVDPEWGAPASELLCGEGRLGAHVLAVFPTKPSAVEPTFPQQKLAWQWEGHVSKPPRSACRTQLVGHEDGAATCRLHPAERSWGPRRL